MKQRHFTQASLVWTHGNQAHNHMPKPTSLREELFPRLGESGAHGSSSGHSGQRLQVLQGVMNALFPLVISATLCCNGLAATMAAAPSTSVAPDDTAPMTDDIAAAAAHARLSHCKTPSCKAIMVIHELVDILRFDGGDANGLASIRASNRPQIAGRRLDSTLLSHPALYKPVCATGVRLISRYRFGPGTYEMIVPIVLLINGVDMDLRDHGHCAQDLLAALPGIPANDQIRRNAQSLCANGYENHFRPKAACDVLIQDLKPE